MAVGLIRISRGVRRSLLLALPLCLSLPPLSAQTAPRAPAPARAPAASDEDDPYADREIVVRGQKPPGSVVGDIAPEITLSPADIRAYGVNNISDLLDQLSPQTGSDRGRGGGGPVVLLNGRRISGFGEIRDLPTEAIQRVEILPEEVSLKYGYAADQRVVNIVLRRRFRAVVAQAGGGAATEGGGASTNPEANLVRIQGDQRLSLNLRYQDSAMLRESQRDVTSVPTGLPFDRIGNVAALRGSGSPEIDPALSALAGRPVTVAGVPGSAAGGAPTLGQFAALANAPNLTDVSHDRTLRGSSQQLSTNLVYAHPVFARATATVNGSLSYQAQDALQGLPRAAITIPAGDSFSPFGRPVALYRYYRDDPLRQRTDTLTGHLGLSLNGDRGHWRWSLTGNYDHNEVRTRTQTGIDTSAFQARVSALDADVNPFASPAPPLLGGLLVDRAHATTNSGEVQAVAGGPLFRLPAGPAGANFRVGIEENRFDGTATRAGIDQSSGLARRNASGQVNIDLPIASRRENVLAALGTLSANANLAVRQLSDFGTLHTLGYGLHWVPVPQIDLIASVTDDQGAPTVQQLGNPQIVTPQVRVFDYLAGTTVDVTQLSGGNRGLHADDRRVVKLGATLKPFAKNDFTFVANYLRTRTKNAIATLPEPTADIETAFPDRFLRDAAGTLVRIDSSPVNFAREDRNELRFGFNVSISLKSVMQRKFEQWIAARRAGKDVPPPFPLPQRYQRRAAQQAQGRQAQGENGLPPPPPDGGPPPDGAPPPPPGGGGPGGGFGPPGGGFGGGRDGGFGRGGGFGGGRGNAGGRLQVAVYDTWTLRDDILIRSGVPPIDLLHGGSVTAGGGQPDHRIEVQLGYANNGLGARLSGTYQTATRVAAGAGALAGSGTGDLRFAAFGTANLRLFADLGQLPSLVGKAWARGMRISLEVDNLADSRQRVRDANGDTPLRYQPAYLDPLGRVVRLTIRKLFY